MLSEHDRNKQTDRTLKAEMIRRCTVFIIYGALIYSQICMK
jgi:hypothetical protein